MMKRRHLLQNALWTAGSLGTTLSALSASTYSTSAWGAAPAMDMNASATSANRFLLVFLRGAYDACSLLVPTASDFYYASRPTLAIARPNPGNALAALPVDANWGLHPVLKDSIAPLLARKEVAFIPFAGTNDNSRSHFETQDSMEAGLASLSQGAVTSGFMNRLAKVTGVSAISFTDALPTIFKGDLNVPNISLRGVTKPAFDMRQSNIIADMYRARALDASVREGLNLRQEVGRDFNQEMQAANRGAVTAKGFEVEARRIAKMMRERYALGFVDIGDWDTHTFQGGAKGQLADHLGDLGRGLAGFADEMGPDWKKTVVVVVSEFGRTFRENGSHGTDHGHGTVFWVMGGGLARANVVGEQIALTPTTLYQDRDYPVLNEYRGVLSGLLDRMYGLTAAQQEKVFAGGVVPQNLGLL